MKVMNSEDLSYFLEWYKRDGNGQDLTGLTDMEIAEKFLDEWRLAKDE
jgi:hypothetical protein